MPRRAESPPPRLLLVGGGHANVALLKAAGRWTARGAQVTLLTPERFLFYSGMSPEYLGGVYSEEDVHIDLGRLAERAGVTFERDAAARIDAAGRVVETASGERLPYDLAVVDVGGRPAAEERAGGALRVKPLSALRGLRAWLDRNEGGHLIVVGGGPAGVEVLLNATGRVCGDPRWRFTLLEPGERLLRTFAPGLGQRAEAVLRARGVDVRLGTRVERAGEAGVELPGGGHLAGDLVLWATGTRGHPLFAASGLEVDARGGALVTRRLHVPGHPGLLIAGDSASVLGRRLDRSGVNAVHQGLYLRGAVDRLLRALLAGHAPGGVRRPAYRPYPASPYLISTGSPEGWVALGPRFWLRGRTWLLLKHLADRTWSGRYHGRQPPRARPLHAGQQVRT